MASTLKKVIRYEKDLYKANIELALNDCCKNGHSDFKVSYDAWGRGSSISRWQETGGGCDVEQIDKLTDGKYVAITQMAHSDWEGIPLYPSKNGLYLMHNPCGNGKVLSREEFCKYLRVTPAEYDTLKTAENTTEFAIMLLDLKIKDRWKAEADVAIAQLLELTGETSFEPVKERSMWDGPPQEEMDAFRRLKAEGYFTEAKKKARAKAKTKEDLHKRVASIKVATARKIREERQEAALKLLVARRISPTFDNFILYNHSNKIVFNWLDHTSFREVISAADFIRFTHSLTPKDLAKLPPGVVFERLTKGD